MSALLMSVIVFACVISGAFLGMFLRNTLPKHHLRGYEGCRKAGNGPDWDDHRSRAWIADRFGKQHF